MGVQKSKKTRSKRGSRRQHQKLKMPNLSMEKTNEKIHIRHHISSDGYYKGIQIINKNKTNKKTKRNT